MEGPKRLRLSWGQFSLELEGDEAFIERYLPVARELLERLQACSPPESPPSRDAPSQGRRFLTLREFYDLKAPKDHPEAVAVFAYWLREYEGRREFREEDIKRCYREAGVRMPKRPAQAIRDAKNRRGFVASRERGTYFLSESGENFVKFDLPRR